VRAFEDRIDLLKVLIVGPVDTPYYQCLFEFDICLPSDYPSVPPLIFFYSRSQKLNPNLYTDGTVCCT
jgi:ubiquitin-conjugating enzyme E2 O